MSQGVKYLLIFLLIFALVAAMFLGIQAWIENSQLKKKIEDMNNTIARLQEQVPSAAQIVSVTTVIHPSYLPASWYDNYIKAHTGLKLTGAGLLKAEKDSGICAKYLLAIAEYEAGSDGSNHFAVVHNNVMSWGVAANPAADWDDRERTWSSQDANVYEVAKALRTAYVDKRKLMTLYDIGLRYCNATWATGVVTKLNKIESYMPEQQRMMQWTIADGIFRMPVTWDYEHWVFGWGQWRIQHNKTILGRP